jgi:paraquat-inducible protein B
VLVTEDRVEKALVYLAETDERHAKAKALVKGMEQILKTTRSQAFLEATGTVAEREAMSYTAQTFKDATKRYENAVADFEIMENVRTRHQLVIDIWRTLEASRRRT